MVEIMYDCQLAPVHREFDVIKDMMKLAGIGRVIKEFLKYIILGQHVPCNISHRLIGRNAKSFGELVFLKCVSGG